MLEPLDTFARRHLGPSPADVDAMLRAVGAPSVEALIAKTVPADIRLKGALKLEAPVAEHELLQRLKTIAQKNQVFRSLIGLGYHDTITPGVILRNVFQNPGWYTQYTPYQAEIAQGRLEALLNFQTMIADLTSLPVSNASLLDEATAAAEAMAVAHTVNPAPEGKAFFVSKHCLPQSIAVVRTRAAALGWKIVVGDPAAVPAGSYFGALLQYPHADGLVSDDREIIARFKAEGAVVVVAADLLSLCLLTPPGELGADIAVGSAQRFGVPLGFGGPHAGYLATRADFIRHLPGRIIGVSEDAQGRRALRMTLQTREQHIRREKATSNICTAQVLLAVMAGFYGVYHGPRGLRDIAARVHALAASFADTVRTAGLKVVHSAFFDTVRLSFSSAAEADRAMRDAEAQRFNLRRIDPTNIAVAFDETISRGDLEKLVAVFTRQPLTPVTAARLPPVLERKSAYLTHPVFNRYHSETEMLRYIRSLEAKDLSLTHSMIPLGSCTMKLNATTEMEPVTWPEFSRLHPCAPASQTEGYQEIIQSLERVLKEVTGFAAVSFQPNAGSQGEYAGLLTIRGYLASKGQGHRDVCLIPQSAHGTNPASAVMAGLKVITVRTDEQGNIDTAHLKTLAEEHKGQLAALMVTYPSTHGVFEQPIRAICDVVHANGGQVYMDGANMNAQVGLCRPGDFGADVCHLNLHKTFCIPHGGGGPGMGPIGVASHLVPFLPGHPLLPGKEDSPVGAVSAAPYGSPSILLISWAYAMMMGADGLRRATELAILNANYLARKLGPHFPVLYQGTQGTVAHECILDCRRLKTSAGVEVEDIAKRLMDYGFHAPTVSFPVAGTLMIEPTESESRAELDRFCDAMISIAEEITQIEKGAWPRDNNPLKNAPHTSSVATADEWNRPYSRSVGVFPRPWVRARKFWPSTGRVNNTLGDRKLMVVCPPEENLA